MVWCVRALNINRNFYQCLVKWVCIRRQSYWTPLTTQAHHIELDFKTIFLVSPLCIVVACFTHRLDCHRYTNIHKCIALCIDISIFQVTVVRSHPNTLSHCLDARPNQPYEQTNQPPPLNSRFVIICVNMCLWLMITCVPLQRLIYLFTFTFVCIRTLRAAVSK